MDLGGIHLHPIDDVDRFNRGYGQTFRHRSVADITAVRQGRTITGKGVANPDEGIRLLSRCSGHG